MSDNCTGSNSLDFDELERDHYGPMGNVTRVECLECGARVGVEHDEYGPEVAPHQPGVDDQ